jgi:hypothetical protein
MGPGQPKTDEVPLSNSQVELTKAAIDAAARITAAMVAVTTEKNPAKISEAYRVIYKTVIDVAKPPKKTAAGT